MLVHEPRAVAADGTLTISLSGELDLRNADDLTSYIARTLKADLAQVIIDLSAVSYLDVRAAQAIISASRLPSGTPPVLRAPGPAVLRVLRASGLDEHCQITS